MPRNVVSIAKRRKIPFAFMPLPRTFLGWLPHLSDSEVRAYLAIAANTLAHNEYSAAIPMTALHEHSGLHRATLFRAIKRLEDRQLLRVARATKHVSKYEILMPPCVAEAQHQSEKRVAAAQHPKVGRVLQRRNTNT